MRLTRRSTIGIAVALALALGGERLGVEAQGAAPIKVGFASAMTGPSAITGEGVKWAAQMLADEYNAKGGIMGRKIEISFGDNAGTPGEAVSAVRKLVDVDKVDVIIGQTHSGACLGALPVVKELQVPMVIEACSNPKIRELIGKTVNEWAFRVNPDDVMLANQFAKYMSQSTKSVSIFAQNDDFGRGAAAAYDVAFKKYGIKLVSTEFFDRGQADYRPVLTRVKRANPEAVLLVMLASEGSVFMRQFREIGLTQKLFARGSMATVEFLHQVKDSPNIADGLVEATYWTPALDAWETEQAFVVQLDLPGLTANQVDVNFDRNTLTVRGTRGSTIPSVENGEIRVFFAERAPGAFSRSLRFPQYVEASKIEASFDNGVLTITVPKAETAKPRKIEIAAN